jgi:hypothetical protein
MCERVRISLVLAGAAILEARWIATKGGGQMSSRIAIALSVSALVLTVAAFSPLGWSQTRSVRAPQSPIESGLNEAALVQADSREPGLARGPIFGFGLFRPSLWAVVRDNGTLLYRSPGVLSSSRIGPGDYIVSFVFPVRACAWLATNRQLDPHSDLESHAANVDTVTPPATNQIEVKTFLETGLLNGQARDSAFSLGVIC